MSISENPTGQNHLNDNEKLIHPHAPVFRKEWHLAHLAGNGVGPQKFNIIDDFVDVEFVLHPPANWTDVPDTKRNQAQLIAFGNAMNAQHAKLGLPIYHGEYYREMVKHTTSTETKILEVTDERLHQLGQRALFGAINRIGQIVHDGPPMPEKESLNEHIAPEISREGAAKIQEFYENSENRGAIDQMMRAARLIKSQLARPEFITIFKLYRATNLNYRDKEMDIVDAKANFKILPELRQLLDERFDEAPLRAHLDQRVIDPSLADELYLHLMFRKMKDFRVSLPFGFEKEGRSLPNF